MKDDASELSSDLKVLKQLIILMTAKVRSMEIKLKDLHKTMLKKPDGSTKEAGKHHEFCIEVYLCLYIKHGFIEKMTRWHERANIPKILKTSFRKNEKVDRPALQKMRELKKLFDAFVDDNFLKNVDVRKAEEVANRI